MCVNRKGSMLRIKKINIKLFCLMFPFCEPYCIAILFPVLHRIFIALKLLSATVIILNFISKRVINCTEHMGGFLTLIVSFWSYLYINTMLQRGNSANLLIGVISVIAVLLLIEINIERMDCMFNVLYCLMEFLVYINLILMMLFPSGLYTTTAGNTNNWLLGYDNFFAQTFIPGMVLAYLKIAYKNGELRGLILIIAINVSTFITVPTTLLVTIIFLDIIFFLGLYKLKKVFNLRNIFIILTFISIGIVFLDMATYFSFFIEEILGKDVSFTGRTTIWASSIEMIASSPIFGYGYVDGVDRVSMMQTKLLGAYNAHNQILELLWEGGVILLAIYTAVIICIIRKIRNVTKMKSTQCLIIGLCSFFIIFIDQAIIQMWPIWYFILLSMTYHADKVNDFLGRGITDERVVKSRRG